MDCTIIRPRLRKDSAPDYDISRLMSASPADHKVDRLSNKMAVDSSGIFIYKRDDKTLVNSRQRFPNMTYVADMESSPVRCMVCMQFASGKLKHAVSLYAVKPCVVRRTCCPGSRMLCCHRHNLNSSPTRDFGL